MNTMTHDKSTPFFFDEYRFAIRIRTMHALPPYKGAVFRGALDNSFRRIACSMDRSCCEECELSSNCLYAAVFHPSPPDTFADAKKFSAQPPPYVLNPPASGKRIFHPGERTSFDLVLVGKARDYLPYFLFAFDQIGRRGLGPERGKFSVEKVELLKAGRAYCIYRENDRYLRTPAELESGPADGDRFETPESGSVPFLAIELETPLRLKQKGRLATRLDFSLFFTSLSRRIDLLSRFYGSGDRPELSDLRQKAETVVTCKDETFWYDWPRYSTRQKTLMKLGGLRGKIEFKDVPCEFVPWIRMGEHINVGQGTTFGLGKYRSAIKDGVAKDESNG